MRDAVSARFPELNSPDLEHLDTDPDGLVRLNAALRLAMRAAQTLQLQHASIIKQELANDRARFIADLVELGSDTKTADQTAASVDRTVVAEAISAAAKTDAALINVLESEMEYTSFLLSRQPTWQVQADGTIGFSMDADLKHYQDIVGRLKERLRQLPQPAR